MDNTLILLVALAIAFDFLNGIHDSSNIVATMISSRAVSPRVALGLTAAAEFTGPFLFGVAVAKTIGSDVINASTINLTLVIVALLSAILWNLLTWFLGIPSSSSHALIGGMIGAAVIGGGFQTVIWSGLQKVLIALFISPLLGLFIGYFFTRLVFLLTRNATPSINWLFKRSQLLTAVALAFSHGTNDAQKTMGVITLGLVTAGALDAFVVPLWVILVSASSLALGTALGGWRLIRTLGGKFYKIKPVDGFCAQTTATAIVLGASLLGGPVSTTQVVSSAIIGVGAADRVNKVRWNVAGDILVAWLVTIPATALMAAGIYAIILRYF